VYTHCMHGPTATPIETILAGRAQFVLDERDWKAFVEMLARPAEVRPAVLDLLRRPRPE
jgi:uncharacterized protein (DUF1778 family)